MHLLDESQQSTGRHPWLGRQQPTLDGFFEFQPAGGDNPPAVVVRYVTIASKFQTRKRKKVTYCPHVSTSYALGM